LQRMTSGRSPAWRSAVSETDSLTRRKPAANPKQSGSDPDSGVLARYWTVWPASMGLAAWEGTMPSNGMPFLAMKRSTAGSQYRTPESSLKI
jgi:hypothetical protein